MGPTIGRCHPPVAAPNAGASTARLDFFNTLLEAMPAETVREMLSKAMAEKW